MDGWMDECGGGGGGDDDNDDSNRYVVLKRIWGNRKIACKRAAQNIIINKLNKQNMKIQVFLEVTLCWMVSGYQ